MLRDNKDSVMAMLEAFVYDPLISWRLLVRPKFEFEDHNDDAEAETSNIDKSNVEVQRSMSELERESNQMVGDSDRELRNAINGLAQSVLASGNTSSNPPPTMVVMSMANNDNRRRFSKGALSPQGDADGEHSQQRDETLNAR